MGKFKKNNYIYQQVADRKKFISAHMELLLRLILKKLRYEYLA